MGKINFLFSKTNFLYSNFFSFTWWVPGEGTIVHHLGHKIYILNIYILERWWKKLFNITYKRMRLPPHKKSQDTVHYDKNLQQLFFFFWIIWELSFVSVLFCLWYCSNFFKIVAVFLNTSFGLNRSIFTFIQESLSI